MTPIVGASSSNLTHRSPSDLLQAAAAVGAACVDLRAGRGQAWEPDLDLVAGRLPVAFLGSGATLGTGVHRYPVTPELMGALIRWNIPLRLFSCPLDTRGAVRRFGADVTRLREAWGPDLRLAVEPHTAAPTLRQLDEVLAEHRIGAVVDTLGLARLGGSLGEARAFVQRHAVAVQVKGFQRRPGGDYHHVALASDVRLASWTVALLYQVAVPITVETRAGTTAEDIRTVLEGLTRPRPQLTHDTALEDSACACAF
jgi:hypothetical protein